MSDHEKTLLTREPESLLTNEMVGYNRLNFVPPWVWVILGAEVEPYDGHNRAQLPSDILGSVPIGVTSKDEETSTRHRTRMSAGRRVHIDVENCLEHSEPHPHWLVGESMWELVTYEAATYDVDPASPDYDADLAKRIRAHLKDVVRFKTVDFDPIGYDPEWDESEKSGLEWFKKTQQERMDARKSFLRHLLTEDQFRNELDRNFRLRIVVQKLQETKEDLKAVIFDELETSPVDCVRGLNPRDASTIDEIILAILFYLREDAMERRQALPHNPPHGAVPKCWTLYNDFVNRLFEETQRILRKREESRLEGLEIWSKLADPDNLRKVFTYKWLVRAINMATDIRLEFQSRHHADPRFVGWFSRLSVEEIEEELPNDPDKRLKIVEFLEGHPDGSLLDEYKHGRDGEPGWNEINGTPLAAIETPTDDIDELMAMWD